MPAIAEPAPMNLLGKEVYRKSSIARAFDVTEQSIDKWVRAGKFPAPVKIGGRQYWEADVVRAYLAERLAAGRDGAA